MSSGRFSRHSLGGFGAGGTKLRLSGAIWLSIGAVSLVSLLPHDQPADTNVGLLVFETLAAMLIGALLVAMSSRVRDVVAETCFHVTSLLGIVFVTLGIVNGGTDVGIVFFGIILSLVALVCSRWTLAFYTVLVIVATAIGEYADAMSGRLAVTLLGVGGLVSLAAIIAWARNQLERLSESDPLCGVANRIGLEKKLAIEVSRTQRSGESLAVAVIDLDAFKATNDRLGHAAGDDILRSITRSWSSYLRASDMIARLGGDEFVLVLPGSRERDARVLVDRVFAATNEPMSVGVAVWRRGESAQDVLRRADMAMLGAKSKGGARIVAA